MRMLHTISLATIAGGVAIALLSFAQMPLSSEADAAAQPAQKLQPVSAFAKIQNKQQRSAALFQEAGKVIQSPRCVNCHPAGERPLQTDRMRLHQPLVIRGDGGMGAASGLQCTTCHREKNFEASGVPGNPKWQLAPIEMAWQGKSLGQICAQIKDRKRNGDRDMASLIDHMTNDELVGWAWNPGGDRTPAAGTQKEFGALIKAWADAGAACPKG